MTRRLQLKYNFLIMFTISTVKFCICKTTLSQKHVH